MKLMFASDIHGSAYYCRRMLELYQKSNANRLIPSGGYSLSRPPE